MDDRYLTKLFKADKTLRCIQGELNRGRANILRRLKFLRLVKKETTQQDMIRKKFRFNIYED